MKKNDPSVRMQDGNAPELPVHLTESELFVERGGRRVIEIFNWLGLSAAIFFLVAHLLDIIPNASGATVAFVVTTVSTIALHRRHYLLCAWILIGGMVGLGFFAALFWNGLRAQLLGLLPIAAMASFIVLPRRQAIPVVILVPIGIVILGYMGEHGMLPKAGFYAESSFAAVYFAYFLFGASLSFVAGKSFQDAISRATMIARRSQKQLEDLKRYESSMSNFFYATPLPSYVLDISGRVLDINQAWAQTFGFTHNEVIGRTTDTIRYWDKIEQRQKLNDALISNEPVITQRADLVVADGSVRTFQMTLAVIKSLDGIRLLVQLVDKTDRSKEEEAQRHYLDQLQRRIEMESGKLKVVPKE